MGISLSFMRLRRIFTHQGQFNYNHGQKSLRHLEITIIFSLDVISPLSRRER